MPPQSSGAPPETPSSRPGLPVAVIVVGTADPLMFSAVSRCTEALVPGAVLQHAPRGEETAQQAASLDPDLVLVDAAIAGPDVLATARRIREETGGRMTPVVAVTAAGREQALENAGEAGINDVVAVPASPEDLAETFARWLPTAEPPAIDQYVDMKMLHISSGGDEAFEQELLAMARDSVGESVTQLRQCARDGDAAGISYIAHKLRGTASAVGFSRMSTLAGRLEKTAAADTGGMAGLIHCLEGELTVVRRILGGA